MSKILAILLEHGKALNIPDEKLEKLKTAIENKEDGDINESEIQSILGEGLRSKLDVVSRNAEVAKNKAKDDAYKAAERKVKGEIETLIKTTSGLSDLQSETLEDLVSEAFGKLTTSGGKGKGGDLTDQAVKTHPLYIQLEKAKQDELKRLKEEYDTKISEIQDGVEFEKTFSEVSVLALKHFDALNPVLSSDETKAKNQRKMVVDMLSSEYKFKKVDDTVIILDKDGNVVEDQYKNKMSLEALVKQKTEPFFDFKKAEERKSPNGGNAGGNGNQGAPGLKYTGKLPTNKQELASMVLDEKIPIDQRIELRDWGAKAELPETAQ